MIFVGTLVVLTLWLGFIWFADPDGYRGAWSETSDTRECVIESRQTRRPSRGG